MRRRDRSIVRLSPPCLGLIAAAVGCTGSTPAAPVALSFPGDDAGAGRDAALADAASDGPMAVADARPDMNAPALAALSLSLPLVPSFSPGTHDYYVRCTAATNTLLVDAKASAGGMVALTAPIATAPRASETSRVTVAGGGALVVSVTAGREVAEYWVRCLPPDFPLLDLTLHPDAGTPTPGYYLLGNAYPAQGEVGYAMMLDGNGVPVWFVAPPGSTGVDDVESLVPGTVSFVSLPTTPTSGFELDNLPARMTSTVDSVGRVVDQHELRVLPNGDSLVFAVDNVPGVDLTGLSDFGPNETVTSCEIQEIDDGGALVWDWNIMDHFDAVKDCTFPEPPTAIPGGGVDPFHCNSIDVDADGNLLVSARNMDSVFLIDRMTGAVVWKMGGARYCRDDSAAYITVTGDPQTSFHRQHDARFLPDGTLSMFDDATGVRGPVRAVIYALDLPSRTASMVWQHEGEGTSVGMGSFRTLADGSRVIGWGQLGTLTFTELGGGGESVLDLSMGKGDVSYRAIKIPTSAFDISALRAATSH